MLWSTQQLEQSDGAVVAQQGPGVERLLARSRTHVEAGLPEMAAFVLMANRTF